MRRIKHHGMEGWVISNGTLLTDEIIEETVKIGWDTIFLSLDAPEPKLNDFLRSREGTFDKVVSSIRRFNAMKHKFGSTTPEVDVGMVLSHYNCGTISEMVRLCADLGVWWLTLQTVHVRPGRGSDFLFTDEDLAVLATEIPKAQTIAAELGLKTNLEDLNKELLKSSNDPREVIRKNSLTFGEHPFLSIPCHSPWYYIGISTEGTIGPCSIYHDTTYKGDVRNTSLKELWTNSHLKEVRERLQRNELIGPCYKCTSQQVVEIKHLRERLGDVLKSS